MLENDEIEVGEDDQTNDSDDEEDEVENDEADDIEENDDFEEEVSNTREVRVRLNHFFKGPRTISALGC